MANAVDLFKGTKLDSTKIVGLPLGKTDSVNGNTWLKTISTWLLFRGNPLVRKELPEEVRYFFMTPEKQVALGDGFAMSRTGFTVAHAGVKISVGDMYKDIKPPMIPVHENKDEFYLELQDEIAIRTNEMMRYYSDLDTRTKIVELITSQVSASINNAIIDYWNAFWCTALSGGANFISDNGALILFRKKSTGADGTAEGNLKKYQEFSDTNFKLFTDRAKRIKNFRWYDPALNANYFNKADNEIELTDCKKPDMGNDLKGAIKKLYQANGKTWRVTREQSIAAMLEKIESTIERMTSIQAAFDNHIEFDTSKEVASTDDVILTRCEKSDLILVVSEWDYKDLVRGVKLIGLADSRIDLASATAGIKKIIKVPGAMPGFAYIGEDWILNLMTELNRVTQKFHAREEETHWIASYWLRGCSFTKAINGCVIGPCANYTPSREFLNMHSKLIKEA